MPFSCRRAALSKSNSSMRLPLMTTTRVSSGWVASMSILLPMSQFLCACMASPLGSPLRSGDARGTLRCCCAIGALNAGPQTDAKMLREPVLPGPRVARSSWRGSCPRLSSCSGNGTVPFSADPTMRDHAPYRVERGWRYASGPLACREILTPGQACLNFVRTDTRVTFRLLWRGGQKCKLSARRPSGNHWLTLGALVSAIKSPMKCRPTMMPETAFRSRRGAAHLLQCAVLVVLFLLSGFRLPAADAAGLPVAARRDSQF